ncbi:MAG: hemolysin [Acidimicrobiales bacterium]|nr:MAG: hemolysin [Acidimicrobiales bacterium]
MAGGAGPAEAPSEVPRLRGRLHQIAAPLAAVGTLWLVRVSGDRRAAVASLVYGLSSVIVYLVSATYHVYVRSPRAKALLRRVDHAAIYLLIAGTFTPVCLKLVGPPWGGRVLSLVWTVAILGATAKVAAFERFRKWGFGLYLGLGWLGVLLLPAFVSRPMLLAGALIGGLLYTTGAILFALRVPFRTAKWFGYHEFWHAVGVAAGVVFFLVNMAIVRGS